MSSNLGQFHNLKSALMPCQKTSAPTLMLNNPTNSPALTFEYKSSEANLELTAWLFLRSSRRIRASSYLVGFYTVRNLFVSQRRSCRIDRNDKFSSCRKWPSLMSQQSVDNECEQKLLTASDALWNLVGNWR